MWVGHILAEDPGTRAGRRRRQQGAAHFPEMTGLDAQPLIPFRPNRRLDLVGGRTSPSRSSWRGG